MWLRSLAREGGAPIGHGPSDELGARTAPRLTAPRGRRTAWSYLLRFAHYWKDHGSRAAVGGAKAVLLGPIYRYIDRRFDAEYDLDTIACVPLKELTILGSHFNGSSDPRQYAGTPLTAFRAVMAALPKDLRDYVFIDFGSGKGRTLLLASKYNFRRVVGVEFSKELCEISRRNIAKYSRIKGEPLPIELINGDAADYEIPNERCVFYFYNPFAQDVMSIVLGKITASYRANPRNLVFIYLSPRVPAAFDRLEFVRAVKVGKFAALTGMIYETVP